MRIFNKRAMTGKQLLIFGLLTIMIGCGLFVSTATADDGLAKVTQVRAQVQATGILLQWQPVEKADGYRIYHQSQTDANRNSLWFDVSMGQTSVLYSDATKGERTSFCVAALRDSDKGPLSSPTSVIWKSTKKAASDTAP